MLHTWIVGFDVTAKPAPTWHDDAKVPRDVENATRGSLRQQVDRRQHRKERSRRVGRLRRRHDEHGVHTAH